MKQSNPVESSKRINPGLLVALLAVLGIGVFIGFAYGASHREPPTKHKGVSVAKLGVLSEASLKAQVGLSGHIMQLREITLAPGGAIAKHSHAKRPGLVWTLSGSWTEGRASGEIGYPATKKVAIVEDESTEHWFWNDEKEPVTVAVCDIVPAP
jgi:quercetin dioxygenase-like cupin family protein